MSDSTDQEQELILMLRLGGKLNQAQRKNIWHQWQERFGDRILTRYIGYHNDTQTLDGDIYQDAMLTAYVEIERGGYQPQDGVPFSAYVKGIARNKIREARRKQRRFVPLDEVFYQIPAGEGFEPEKIAERKEDFQLLHIGIASLDPNRRGVMEALLQGKQTKEIAEEMAISEELVRQHKSRGIRAIRKQLGNLD
jgi:RNA polymerase sigma factor (sigma-70 family)